MKLISTAITGSESTNLLDSATTALVAFYKAFNSQNFELMNDNWADSESCSMSNPLGGIKRGWSEIQQVYQKIFNGKARVYVEFYDYSITTSTDMFIAAGKERGYLKVDETEIQLSIRTSRIYQRINNQWKQIHHHGSIDNPDLLLRYQTTLLNQQ